MLKINWMKNDQHVVINYDGETHFIPLNDPLADKVLEAIKTGNNKDIPEMVSAAKRIKSFSNGEFEVRNGDIFVNGQKVPGQLGRKILQFESEGLPYKPLVRFAEKLLKNPSYRAANELFGFLEKNDQVITEDGDFVCYKRVRSDFKDIYTGTFDNSPGQVVKMPRNQVNEDANQTCSYGLHVANFEYAHLHYGSSNREDDIILEVEVNPEHTVSVPVDYNQAKMRVCEYKVIGVVKEELSKEIRIKYAPQPTNNFEYDYEDNEESSSEEYDDFEESSENSEDEDDWS